MYQDVQFYLKKRKLEQTKMINKGFIKLLFDLIKENDGAIYIVFKKNIDLYGNAYI